ncbi:MerR family transcriptional regulator [Massilia endophytica]|uniref:MerR family transcriptional regulator n=1 Tax=Massilia endophytica TaxID=2899220 RepID=UPI001E558A9A|nr:MerR family transcriptional regulator [Massilia endophytica]UGQ46566.1 MerR family transcriptional regulator [Massilia endophytica]
MSASYSVGRMARRAGISRTTLLYYESLGLVAPARTAAGYRRYSEEDAQRLERIRGYRATGLSLEAVAALIDEAQTPSLLQQRLREIHLEIARLREQQAVLERMLGQAGAEPMNKERWTALQRAAGVDDAAMARWHALFERQAPQAHEDFLCSLGLDGDEIARIRGWARGIGV